MSEVLAPDDKTYESDTPYTDPHSVGPGAEHNANIDPQTTAFVKKWTTRIKSARKRKRTDDAFRRMDEDMQLAKEGAEASWVNAKKYVVAIVNRHINQEVAQLYAKNPTVVAKRKRRRMFTVWDGRLTSLATARQNLTQATQLGQPQDPSLMAVVNDAVAVKQYDTMVDGICDTLTILHEHFWSDQSAQYKQLLKAAVRRAKVCSVAYAKLGFQRILEAQPDITVKIDEVTQQITTLQGLMDKLKNDETSMDTRDADMEQLRTMLADLQSREQMIVNEGPIWSFPRAKAIIVDPKCHHLKTLAGARWIAEEYTDLTPSDIQEIYKVDIKGAYTEYKPEGQGDYAFHSDKDGATEPIEMPARVWRVENRKANQEFVICDGYNGYLKPPGPPDVKLRRFFTIFPLVFNEIEDEKDLYPPSDVHLARHLQLEYNRARQGLREHRQQNKPAYVTGKGQLEDSDLKKFESHESGAILEINQLSGGEKITDKVMAKPTIPIDKALYEVEQIFSDLLRVVGTQQANLGPTTSSTATESAIAQESRQEGTGANTDEVDDWLTQMAQAEGELMLAELSKDTVMQIVGPGAVWPDMEETRKQISDEILLSIKAGSSGRPNAAQELAKRERAMPFILQMPGVNPTPLVEDYLQTLDIDIEGAVVEGLPSISAQNAMAAKVGQMMPGANGQSPAMQGPQGANNAPQPPGTPPGPAPQLTHFDHQGNPIR